MGDPGDKNGLPGSREVGLNQESGDRFDDKFGPTNQLFIKT